MQSTLKELKEILAAKDLRVTPQRQAIMQILLEKKNQHLSADDIYILTKESNPEIGIATIYRTLELFADLGIISKMEFGDGCSRYEFNQEQDGHAHHHLICQNCGVIIEFNEDLLEELESKIAQESKFKITDHCLRFYGYCEQCQTKR